MSFWTHVLREALGPSALPLGEKVNILKMADGFRIMYACARTHAQKVTVAQRDDNDAASLFVMSNTDHNKPGGGNQKQTEWR